MKMRRRFARPERRPGRRRRERTSILVAAFLSAIACDAAAAERRVVSLAPSVTETLFAVGAGDEVVGVTTFCDWPPEARRIEPVGSYLRPSVEAIVGRRPDLVIAVPSPGNRREVEEIEGLGIRVIVVAEGPRLGDVYGSIRTVAEAVGRPAAGAALVARMEERVAKLGEHLARFEPRRVLFVLDRNPLVVAGEGTLLDEILRLVRATNVARGLGPWPRLSLEAVVRLSPEVILDGAMGKDEGTFYRGLDLAAARAGELHRVRVDEVMRPGPRLIDGVEALARLVHPGAFE